MRRTDVVTIFLARRGEILLLKRSEQVGTYQGRWAGVSGYLESDDPVQQAWTEIGEELGLGPGQAALEIAGEPLEVRDPDAGRLWVVHPFRFRLLSDARPRLDREHVEMRWCAPQAIQEKDAVPGLWEAWCRVAEGFDAPWRLG